MTAPDAGHAQAIRCHWLSENIMPPVLGMPERKQLVQCWAGDCCIQPGVVMMPHAAVAQAVAEEREAILRDVHELTWGEGRVSWLRAYAAAIEAIEKHENRDCPHYPEAATIRARGKKGGKVAEEEKVREWVIQVDSQGFLHYPQNCDHYCEDGRCAQMIVRGVLPFKAKIEENGEG